MRPQPLSCAACGEVFPANRELATVPQASTIAFDPARLRAWRVCGSCGLWNLLGREAAAAAMPELIARFAAAGKRPGGADFGLARIDSALELLRIGAPPPDSAADAAIQDRRRANRAAVRRAYPALVLGGFALLADFYWMFRHGSLAGELPGLTAVWAMMYIAYAKARNRFGVPYQRGSLAIAALLIVLGEGIDVAVSPPYYALTLVPMAVILGVLAFTIRPMSLLKARLSSGAMLRLYSYRDIDQVALSWDADGALTLRGFPAGAVFAGADALTVLRSWFKARNNFFRQAASDAGHDLQRAAGGLHGVLQALDGFRDDQTGWVVLGDLPRVYLFALDYALTDTRQVPTRRPGFSARLARATEVAEVAELLDGELAQRPNRAE